MSRGADGGTGERGDAKLKEKIAAIQGKRDRHKAMLADLERTGEDQVSLTDPDSRAMARMTKVGVGYNVQLAVDVKHKLIVEQEVCNQVLDMGLLAPTVEAAMATLGVDRIEAVADKGYFKIEEVEACEKAGITAYLPKPVRGPAVREGFFTKEAFRFDPEKNVYTCPAGQTLSPCRRGRSRDNVKIDYANPTACKGCSLRPRCTKTYRHVSRLENEAVLDRMAARLKGLSQTSGVDGSLATATEFAASRPEASMILSAIAAKLKRRSKDDFKGRHFEAGLIVQAVSWYLRYPLSYRDVEELLLERGLEVDHSTVNRWVLAYAPLIERRLRPFRQASLRVDPRRRDLRPDPGRVALPVPGHRQARRGGRLPADR